MVNPNSIASTYC